MGEKYDWLTPIAQGLAQGLTEGGTEGQAWVQRAPLPSCGCFFCVGASFVWGFFRAGFPIAVGFLRALPSCPCVSGVSR